jgi:hypothetical protein
LLGCMLLQLTAECRKMGGLLCFKPTLAKVSGS